jgi:hypothetical protein
MVNRIIAPRDIHVLIPGPINMLYYIVKDFAGIIKLRILRWEDYPGISGLAQCNESVLKRFPWPGASGPRL